MIISIFNYPITSNHVLIIFIYLYDRRKIYLDQGRELASLAYTLLEAIRRLALKGAELAKAQCGRIRLKLLKVGAVITKNTRRI